MRAFPPCFFAAVLALTDFTTRAGAEEMSDIPRIPLGVFLAMSDLSYVPPEIIVKTRASREEYYATQKKPDEFKNAERYLADYGGGFYVLGARELPEEVGLAEFMGATEPHATLFRRRDRRGEIYVLAFRGTKTVADWLIDIGGAVGFVPSYYEKSNALVDRLWGHLRRTHPGATLVLAGHSLGGGIAEYAASRHGLVAVTFNSAHLSHRFPTKPEAAIFTYHVIGRDAWWSGDVVNLARLGGNFEQTATTSVPVGTGFIVPPHSLQRYYEHKPWEVAPLPDQKLRTGFTVRRLPGSTLLQSMPTLVADAPPPVRAAIHRRDVDDCPLFADDQGNGLPNLWDLRFRVSRIYDSYPSGGLPDEDLRILVPPSGAPLPPDWATAFELQSAFSHPFSRVTSVTFWTDRRSLNYHQEKTQDFSTFSVGSGLVWADRRNDATWTLGGKYQRFKSVVGNAGHVLAVETATSWQPAADRWLLWSNASAGTVRRSGVPGANGTLFDGNVGLRYQLTRSRIVEDTTFLPRWQTVVQLRAFDALRTSDDPRFANAQWGGGLGLTYQGKYFRAFVEPALRYTRHHVAAAALTTAQKLSDHEIVWRAELAWSGRVPLGMHQLVGWEFALGYTHVASDPVERVILPGVQGSYDRNLFGAQLSKRF